MIQIPQNLCTDLTDEQASTVQGGRKLTIKRIQAVKAGADPGFLGGSLFSSADDTYLTVDGKQIFGPEQFSTGTSISVNKSLEVGDTATIRAFDDDNFLRFGDDDLGSATVSKATAGGVATLSGSGSTYEVFYSLSA